MIKRILFLFYLISVISSAANASAGAADVGVAGGATSTQPSHDETDDHLRLYKSMTDELKTVKQWLEDSTVQIFQLENAKTNMQLTCRNRISMLEKELLAAASKQSHSDTSKEQNDRMKFHQRIVDDLKLFKEKLEDTSVELFQLAKSKSMMEQSYEKKIATLEQKSYIARPGAGDFFELHSSIAADMKLYKKHLEDTNVELDRLQKAKDEMERTFQARIAYLENNAQSSGKDNEHDDSDRMRLHTMMAEDSQLLKKALEDSSVELFQLLKSHSNMEQTYQERMARLEEQQKVNADRSAKHDDGDHLQLHTLVADDMKLLRRLLEDTYVELHHLAVEKTDMVYKYERQIESLKQNLANHNSGDHLRLQEIIAGDAKLLRKQLEDTYVELHQLAIAKKDMEYEYESQLNLLRQKVDHDEAPTLHNKDQDEGDDGRIALHKVMAEDLKLYKRRLEDTSVDLFQVTKAKTHMEQEYQDRIASLRLDKERDHGDRMKLHEVLAEDLKLYKKRLEDTSVELFQMMKAKTLMEQEYQSRITKFGDRQNLHEVMAGDLKLVKKHLEDATVQLYQMERSKANMEESYEKRIAAMDQEFKQWKAEMEEKYQSRISGLEDDKSNMSEHIGHLKEDLEHTKSKSQQLRHELLAANERIHELEVKLEQWYIVRAWNEMEPKIQRNMVIPLTEKMQPILKTKTFQRILAYRQRTKDDMEYWIREVSSAVQHPNSPRTGGPNANATTSTATNTATSWLYDSCQFVHRNSHSIVEWTEFGLYVSILNLIFAILIHFILGRCTTKDKKNIKNVHPDYEEDDDNTEQTSSEVTLDEKPTTVVAMTKVSATKKRKGKKKKTS